MRKVNSILVMVASLLLSCSSETNPDSQQEMPNHAAQYQLVFDIDSLLSNEKLDTIHISYDWAVQQQNKRYQGVASKFLFSKLIADHRIDTTGMEVIFLCKDGYSARVPFYQLLNQEGYVVNKDVDAALQWDTEINDKFGPAYLVWNVDKNENNFSFPYGISQIEIVDIDNEYRDVIPTNVSEDLLAGFSLYKKYCIKCHSINRVGGRIGPELNTPINVTEYWKSEHLERFILDPTKYRFNSKMPAFTHLGNDDVRSIVEYLTHMAENKKM